MTKRKLYSSEDLDAAVSMRLQGAKLPAVVRAFPTTPERTISHRAKQARDGVAPKKCGKQPVLIVPMENDLRDWIVEMQRRGDPVNRDRVLVKGNEMFHEMFGNTRWSKNCLRRVD